MDDDTHFLRLRGIAVCMQKHSFGRSIPKRLACKSLENRLQKMCFLCEFK